MLRIQNLPHLSPGVFIVSAVDQANLLIVQFYKPDLGGALDIVTDFGNLDQFIHCRFPSLFASRVYSFPLQQ